MATTYYAQIQQLYVAYFNRPADVAGLQYWETVVENAKGSTAAVSAAFAASAEYKAAYANMDAAHIVNAVYNNLFGHDADVAGLNFWAQNLLAGKFTIDQAVTAIAAGAQGTDATTFQNRVTAATAFTGALTTTQQQLDYTGTAANAAAKAFLAGVTDNTSLANAIAPTALANTVNGVVTAYLNSIGQTYALTAGVDTLVGTAGNDFFTATISATTGNPLNAFDSIDGGAGTNTLSFIDTTTPSAAALNIDSTVAGGATVKNIQNVTVTTTGGALLNTTGWTGVTTDTVSATGSAAVQVTAANTTAVNVNSASTNGATITGGSAVNVALSAGALAGTVGVTGAGLTTVSVTGGNGITVNNTSATGAAGAGTTLTAATLTGIAGGATLSGTALTSVSLNNVTSSQTVTVNNSTASHTLNVAANAVGYTSTGTAAAVTVADAVATTVAFNVSAKSDLALSAAAATKVTIAGAGATLLDLTNAQAKLATVDASASTGSVTLSNLGAGVTSVTTGSGNASFTMNTATSAATTSAAAVNATVTTGAGNDVVDLRGITGTGSFTVSTGAGNDTIMVNQSQLAAGSTIDGGAGTNSLVLGNTSGATFAAGDYALINSTIANVQNIEFANAVGGVDASQLSFTGYTFDNTGVITNVSGQTLSTTGTGLTATASGYSTGASGTTYAGNLVVNTTNAASALSLNADTATVNVKSTTSVAASTTIGGDLQTSLTVNLTNSANASSNPTGDMLSSANILVNGTQNTALKSIVLTGAGTVNIDASASGALTNVDASQLGGTIANGANKGNITGGLNYIGNLNIAETITLGSGHDTVTVNSTYAKMDTIIGFDAVKEDSTGATTSDVLIIKQSELNGATGDLTINGTAALTGTNTTEPGLTKMTLGAGDTTLALAFVHAAAVAGTNVVEFQFGGNTYLFADTNGNGHLDNSDFAVKLVGNIDVTGAFGIPPAGH